MKLSVARNISVVAVVFLSLTSAVFAESSKRESVEELLEISNVDSMMDSMYGQMTQMFSGMEEQLGVQPEEREVFNNYMARLVEAMQKEMSWEVMKEPMIDLYLKHYSEQEIQDILAFYRSDTGRSMIEKMPAVMQDSMQVSQEMMVNFIPRLKEISEELKKELEENRSQ